MPSYHTGPDDETTVDVVLIGAGYFEAVGVPIVEGRAISASDVAQQRRVAMVNETMARLLWPQGNAVGGRLHTEGRSSEPYEVIGVARDHKVRSVGEAPQPYLHLPTSPSRAIGLIVRTVTPAAGSLPALRQAVWGLEPNAVFTEDVDAASIAATTMAPTEIGAVVVGAFGVVALVLATVGLYGVVAYSVSRRTREVGIRMAIGATRGQVVWLILSQGARLALGGIVMGGIGAVFAARLLQSLFYGVSATDPLAFGIAAAIPARGGAGRERRAGARGDAGGSGARVANRLRLKDSGVQRFNGSVAPHCARMRSARTTRAMPAAPSSARLRPGE